MNPFDLKQTLIDACRRHHFPSDIRQLFISLKENAQLINALKGKHNEFQNTANDLLYDLILQTYLSQKKSFIPAFKYEMHDIVYNTNLPRLCLNLHSKFSPLTAILIEKNCPFAVVSDYQNTVKQVAFNSGIRSGKIEIISRNEACLLNTKHLLTKNYLVNSTIDFRKKRPGAFNLLSDSMLRLALHIRPDTLCGVHFVNDSGVLVYVTKAVNLDQDLDKIKQDVIHFFVSYKQNAQFAFEKFDYLEQKNALSSYMAAKKTNKASAP